MRHQLFTLSVLAAAPACAPRVEAPDRVPFDRPAPAHATQPASVADAPAAPFDVVTEIHKVIWAIYQDRAGAYWFGSDGRGAYRFDGTSLAQFTSRSGLCSDHIRGIQEDGAGNLYFRSDEGISKFDGRSFATLEVSASDPASTEWKLEPDDLWFPAGQDTGAVLRYDGKSLRRLAFPATPLGDEFLARSPRSQFPNMKYSPYDVYTVFKDSKGSVWFGTSSLGACRYDGTSFAWISEKDLEFDLGDRSFGVRSIIEDRDGKFWLTHTRYRYEVDPSTTSVQSTGGLRYAKEPGLHHAAGRGEEPYSYVMSTIKDDAGDLWMATYGAGVWRFDGATLTHFPVQVGGVPITVFSIYKDRQGALWLCTHEHGVCKFDGTAFEKVVF